MERLFARLPLLVTLIGVSGLAMLVPAAHAAVTGEARIAEIYFYHAALTLLIALFIGIARAGRDPAELPRRHLWGLFGLFVLMPLLFAVPFQAAIRTTSFLNAYVEMVSSFTTTGATLFEDPTRLAPSLHLWRATVAWLGGFYIWVGAIAVMAPMGIGGFEVRFRPQSEQFRATGFSQISEVADMSERVRTFAGQLAPLYIGLTGALWIGLIVAGDTPLVAMAHAMSTLSTSGISPVGGLTLGNAGWAGEVMVFTFLIFAISRLTFAREGQGNDLASLKRDPEIRIGAAIVAFFSLFLFVRHFLGAVQVEGVEASFGDGLASLWGAAFTVLSYLTTTGFESASWAASRDWSGLQAPGLILVGLAMVGGGVATTAGGAKLLRIYALYKHGVRELERLVHPHSVARSEGGARHLRRRGAYMAWLFFMLTLLSLGVVMAAFSLTGLNFEKSLVLTIAALTTTGPLAAVAAAEPVSYATLTASAKLVLTAAMILGRLETLAIVALLVPSRWR